MVPIVIPPFNKGGWVTQTLLSLNSQKYRHRECLIINGGSTGNSLTIIQDLVNQHAGDWSIMININRCPSAAQNLGIHNAKGEYLVFLVAGDFWHPNKLKQQIETMVLDTSITMTLSCYLIFSEGTGPTIKVVTFASIEKLWSGWLEMTVIPVD